MLSPSDWVNWYAQRTRYANAMGGRLISCCGTRILHHAIANQP